MHIDHQLRERAKKAVEKKGAIGPDVNPPGEERKYQVHMNAINIEKLILPQEGKSVEDTIRRDLAEKAGMS